MRAETFVRILCVSVALTLFNACSTDKKLAIAQEQKRMLESLKVQVDGLEAMQWKLAALEREQKQLVSFDSFGVSTELECDERNKIRLWAEQGVSHQEPNINILRQMEAKEALKQIDTHEREMCKAKNQWAALYKIEYIMDELESKKREMKDKERSLESMSNNSQKRKK